VDLLTETSNKLLESFTIWDVDGQDKIRLLWRHYFENTDAVIFVIDSSDRTRFDEAMKELDILLNAPELSEAVLLVFANKQDLPQAISVMEITDKLLSKINQNRCWHIQATCAKSGDGLYEGLQWLTNILKK